MDERTVEILGVEGSPGKGGWLGFLHNPDSGKYFAPEFLDIPFFDVIRKMQSMGMTGKGWTIAILDTGLMLDHPWIKRQLLQSKDFTGEGPEDKNGHGTLMALNALLVAPDANIVNIKVMDAEGRGTEENIVKGIDWAVEQKVDGISISAGVDHSKWLLPDCKGTCKLCKAAENADKAGIIVSAAAGNEPNKTYCPARLGMVKKDNHIISCQAFDLTTGKIASYSGKGNATGPVGMYHFIPVV
jgi:subtilisin family serine protease